MESPTLIFLAAIDATILSPPPYQRKHAKNIVCDMASSALGRNVLSPTLNLSERAGPGLRT